MTLKTGGGVDWPGDVVSDGILGYSCMKCALRVDFERNRKLGFTTVREEVKS